MPDRRPAQLLADLRFEVSTVRGSTSGHLYDTDAGLVLDVADPEMLLTAIPSRRALDTVPRQAVADVLGDTSVSVRANDQELMRLRLTNRLRLRVRPRPAGVLLAVRLYARRLRPARAAVPVGLGVVGLVAFRLVRGRRQGQVPPA